MKQQSSALERTWQCVLAELGIDQDLSSDFSVCEKDLRTSLKPQGEKP